MCFPNKSLIRKTFRKGAAVDRTMRHDSGNGGAKAKFDKKKESPQNSGNIPKVEGKGKIKKNEKKYKNRMGK